MRACAFGLVTVLAIAFNAQAGDLQSDLRKAAERGERERILSLVEKGARLDETDRDGWTALLLAMRGGHRAAAQVLIEKGADVNVVLPRRTSDRFCRRDTKIFADTPLAYALALHWTDIGLALLERGAVANGVAAYECSITVAEPGQVVVTGNRIGAVLFEYRPVRDSYLNIAVRAGNPALVSAILENGARLDDTTASGETALHITARPAVDGATREGRVEVVKVLIGKGAPVDATDGQGATPLISVVANLTNGRAYREAAALVLMQNGADVKAANREGVTPLHYAAVNADQGTLNALLERGADVNARAENGLTPLIWSAQEGKLESVQALLKKGADVGAATKDGRTAMNAAEKRGHMAIVTLLREQAPQ